LIWVVESHRDATTADRDLGEYLIKSGPRKSDDWTGFIADFLVGKVSAKDFMDSKNSFVGSNRRRRCQTWYFAGMKSLAEKDKNRAIEYLHQAVSSDLTGALESRLARAELQFLGK